MARAILGGRLRVARDMLDADDMEGIEPVGVTTGETVTLGNQEAQQDTSQQTSQKPTQPASTTSS